MTTLYRSWSKGQPTVKVSEKPDPELVALEAGLAALQGQRATSRCLQVVVKRRSELAAHSRKVLEAYLRGVEVPGYRIGKAPAERMVQIVTKFPRYERIVFRRCFRYWMELNTGLPERVTDVGRQASPGIDFATADWNEISAGARAIVPRMPHQEREDILLALFAARFGPSIVGPCVCGNCGAGPGPQSEVSDSGPVLAEPSAEGVVAEPSVSAPSTAEPMLAVLDESSSSVAFAASAQEARATEDSLSQQQAVAKKDRNVDSSPGRPFSLAAFDAVVEALLRVDATSSLWDAEFERFLNELAEIRKQKLAERAAYDVEGELRQAIESLLQAEICEELRFLGLYESCASWTPERLVSERERKVPASIAELVADLHKHRVARLGAQHAANDEAFEAHTAMRRASKQRVVVLVGEIGLHFEDLKGEPDGRAGAPSHREMPSPMHNVPVALSAPATIDAPIPSSSGELRSHPTSPLETSARDTKEETSEHADLQGTSPASPSPVPTYIPSVTEPPHIASAPHEANPQASLSVVLPQEPDPTASHYLAAGAGANRTLATSTAGSAPNQHAAVVEPRLAKRTLSAPDRIALESGELGLAALMELPDELTSYERFRDEYWTAPSQRVERAPWKLSGFLEAVTAAAVADLAAGPSRAWRQLILSNAIEVLGGEPPVASADIRSASALWISPESRSAGFDADRCERLRSGQATLGTSRHRIALILEAVRPSAERQLLPHEIDSLVENASFESGALRVVTQRLLTANAQGYDALDLIRHFDRAGTQNGLDVLQQFDKARKELQALTTRLSLAAGGKIQRAHCRQAWTAFVGLIQPSLVRLLPPPRGDESWAVADMAQQVDGYASALEDTCDRYEAWFDDKRRMIRAAAEIADAARRVIELRRSLLRADSVRKPPFTLPEVELAQLSDTGLESDDEEFGRKLLLRAIRREPLALTAVHPLAITIRELCEWPDLLRVVRDVPPESIAALREPAGALAYADDLTDKVRAAAIAISPREPIETPTVDHLVGQLESSLRAPLLGLIVQALDERLQGRVHANRSTALGRLVTAVSQLSQVVEDLEHLGNRFASALRTVRDLARTFVEEDDVRLDTRLIEAWLTRVLDIGRGYVKSHVEELAVEAANSVDKDEIETALARGHYGRAVRLLHGHSGSDLRQTRQTDWRDAVGGTREDRQRMLEGITDPKLKSLLDAWRVGIKGDAVRADRTLRTEFVKIVCEGRNMDRQSEPAYMAIPMSTIRAELAHDQLMPTWMPQLSRFSRLTIVTPPVSPEQPNFKQGALAKLGEFHHDLVLILAPHLPTARRAEILQEIRRRSLSAAVIDDLDLLRLINPRGQRPHQMMGTLEIALEQQRRGFYSPFDLSEGSSVRLEMYVGRQDKARELARTANYSRLFSGRKLGKSALLRFIENTEGGVKLPSGNALRVVYVPAVGIWSESVMVETIVESIEGSTHEKLARPNGGDPGDKLTEILTAYLTAHRTESLLLVLDEADVFFERQLAAYEESRERCLSFQMRSRLSSLTDANGLPRVRFVFAGYRVTNRSQGAWSNWGRVLSLDPLEPEDAARLIAGPLAVMGIDVGAHAHEIAYRCGYQPAIILKFGERLMELLERQQQRSEHYVVTATDIAQVLEDPRVHDEIRTIASNNFEGNPAGFVVFGAFLRELLELPPGQPLRDAPHRIVDRLRQLDADLDWLEREGDGSATVRSYLSDFVERFLLQERRVDAEPSYSLRFPHHLTILASLAADTSIREELRRARTGAATSTEHVERALVPPRVLRDLADASQPNSNAVAIVGTLWPTATYDRSGGMADRLGATREEIADASQVTVGNTSLEGLRVLLRTDVTAAEQIIDETLTAPARPIFVGGADLIRWAIARRRSAMDLLYEVHGVGRLSMARLVWWFQRVRGLEFVRPDALERIHKRTGGMPVLLEIVDSQLIKSAGNTVSNDRVELALSALDDAIPVVARELVQGRPATALQGREREILEMVECVVRLDPTAGNDLAGSLTELWELYADQCPIPPLSSTDAVALEVLLELGLLPAKMLAASDDPIVQVANIAASDPLFAIVRAFPMRQDTHMGVTSAVASSPRSGS